MARAFLDRSIRFDETIANVVRLVVPRVADYAAIALVADEGAVTWGFSAHCNPVREPLVGRLRSTQPHLSQAMFTSPKPDAVQFIRRVDSDVLRRVAHDDNHLALLSGLGLTSMIILRLTTRRRLLGTLVLATSADSERLYDDHDIAIATEVARRVSAALERALLLRAAEHAARAREEVLAVVAHDLKNPVNTIQLAACFLLDEVISDNQERGLERKTLGVIARAAKQMDRLIRDLLDVAAIEAGRLALDAGPLAVEMIVNDALELLRPIAVSRSIALVADLPGDLPRVTADRDRVLQVLSNLGGNAVKFSSEGGRVRIVAQAAGPVVEFAIHDNGAGISHGDLPHIFDRFWQQKPTARLGTGLGLAIAKGIIDAHGGDLRAESEPGKGSCFTFTLPVAAG
jgi:signal transduction histidine kinase